MSESADKNIFSLILITIFHFSSVCLSSVCECVVVTAKPRGQHVAVLFVMLRGGGGAQAFSIHMFFHVSVTEIFLLLLSNRKMIKIKVQSVILLRNY